MKIYGVKDRRITLPPTGLSVLEPPSTLTPSLRREALTPLERRPVRALRRRGRFARLLHVVRDDARLIVSSAVVAGMSAGMLAGYLRGGPAGVFVASALVSSAVTWLLAR